MSEHTILDLDSILDQSMDEIPDVPEFLNPPSGNYVLAVEDCKPEEYKTKDGEKGLRIKITYKVIETIEVADNQPPVPNGTLFTEQFQATPEGLGFFKQRAKKVLNVESLEGTTNREVMGEMKGQEFKARIVIRKSKGQDGREYENVNVRPYHA